MGLETLDVLLEKKTEMGAEAVSTAVTLRQDGGYEIAPADGFEPNTVYSLTVPDYCDGSGELDTTALVRQFSTSVSAPLPEHLGTISIEEQLTGPLMVATVSGSCNSETTSTHANVRVALATETSPWASMLVYEARVDGEPFNYLSSLGSSMAPSINGGTKLYTICSAIDRGVLEGLGAGEHQVTFVATLPGSDLELATPPLDINLDCRESGGCGVARGVGKGLLPIWTLSLLLLLFVLGRRRYIVAPRR